MIKCIENFEVTLYIHLAHSIIIIIIPLYYSIIARM